MSTLVAANGNFTNARANTFVIASKLAADPASQGADRAILYLKDDGNGTAQLKIKAGNNAPIAFGNLREGTDFKGRIQNHYDSSLANTQIVADLSSVQFGSQVITPAQSLIFNKATTGAGGMQAAAVNSTWNKLYYIRKASDGTEALFGLRAKQHTQDLSWAVNNTQDDLRVGATDRVKLAQGFQTTRTGLCEFVDVPVYKNNSPVGNYWFTIESDTAGSPSGTVLATSDKYDVARLPNTAVTSRYFRVPFRIPATLTTGVQYHLVLQADYAPSATVRMTWNGHNVSQHAGGSAKKYDGTTWAAAGPADFGMNLYITEQDTALSLPSGYTQYIQIGWFYIDGAGSGNIKRFKSIDKKIIVNGPSWKAGTTPTGTDLSLVPLAAFIPPSKVAVEFAYGTANPAESISFSRLYVTDAASGSDIEGQVVGAGEAGGATRPTHLLPPIDVEYQTVILAQSATAAHGYWVTSIQW